ncbi:MAG: bis(5'-nucleosyl)-tetraphosphatase (symmetrical) YqeK [Bacilli bacterium]|nr:bis(5'-nucleosyl)-tetraphosphatase (symmetrical) YqeK [Bacilli bacterium]
MNYNQIYETVEKRFSHTDKQIKRFNHSKEVVKMALYLNEHLNLNLDIELVKITAILHDYGKNIPEDEQLKLLEKYLTVDEINHYKSYLPVVHSILGAYLVKDELQIDDDSIFDAIYYHTTGKKKMSTLTKLIYVSDAVELSRTYPNVEHYRRSCYEDLDKGVYEILKGSVESLKARNLPIENNTIEALRYYEEYLNEV